MITTAQTQVLRTGDLLVQRKIITRAQLDVALRQQRAMRENGHSALIGEIIASLKFADEKQIEQAISAASDGAHKAGYSTVLLSNDLCRRYQVTPLMVEKGVLYIQSAQKLSDIKKSKILSGCLLNDVHAIKVVAGEKASILNEIARHQEREVSLDIWIRHLRTDINGINLKGFLEHLILEASMFRASDIHIDKRDDYTSWISYRIDGHITQKHLLPEKMMAAIFTRIKSESGMDPSQTRVPQDGRMTLEFQKRKLDVRVASQPLADGETLTLRLLSQSNLRRIDELFTAQPDILRFLRGITKIEGKAGGLIIVSGSTGSGKSTTIYAIAQEFERDRINVMTVEDPVEYTLPMCRQIQINQLLEQRATDMETSLLRQDPDVVIFGELRDENFARAVLKLTESGHLCLSTIHAIDANQTFERLQSVIGLELRQDMMFVLANYLKAIINQRLIRKLCSCAIPVDEAYITKHHGLFGFLNVDTTKETLKMHQGCKQCHNTGYLGRTDASESLLISDDESVRDAVRKTILSDKDFDFKKINAIPGVKYISRINSLCTLIENGVIDVEIADATLGSNILQQGVAK